LSGSFLLARKKRSGFIFYSASSALTAFLSLWTGLYGLVFLHLAYITLDTYGYIQWNTKKVENPYQNLTNEELLESSKQIAALIEERQLLFGLDFVSNDHDGDEHTAPDAEHTFFEWLKKVEAEAEKMYGDSSDVLDDEMKMRGAFYDGETPLEFIRFQKSNS
jgi:hypothetical protein